jgi:hypothetical protein
LPGRILGLVAIAAVAVAGCSRGVKKVTVHGTVSYKGQTLQSGILQFAGPEGAYSAAAIQSDGTYIITDVVPGEVKVAVVEAPQGSGGPSADEKKSSGPKRPPVSLPDKYRDPEKSGLKYNITPDTKELPIEIN